jgi:hypothetical protein
MQVWALSFLLLTNIAFAEVGKISKVLGSSDAYVMRGTEKKTLSVDTKLEVGDELFSQNSVLLVHIYPTTQLSLAKQTQVKITKSFIDESNETDKAFSIINFIKGLVRVQVVKEANLEVDQKIEADGVAFAVRGTEFEVSSENGDYDLDVLEGEVEVSSPFIQTFVPEIVKANEGFKFNKKARKFERRKFRRKFKDAPAFASKDELHKNWKQKRKNRKLRKKGKK